jgi:hypothetical protein
VRSALPASNPARGVSTWVQARGRSPVGARATGDPSLVVATDVDARNLAPLAREGIEVLVHDVVVDDFPPNSFDVLALAGTDYDWSRTFPTPLVPTAVATSARW